ncbi:MAG TPA: adenine phosphoribosyltransferase [Polyangia bacterium]|jgi:adenine phosphoribosyltransferase
MSASNETVDPRLGALRAHIRDIEDFPKPGIMFRDLTPLMGHGPSLRACVDLVAERVARHRPDVIVAVEARGFIFGAPVAAALGIGFAPVRKPGKLPWRTSRQTYDLEYGTDSLEMHADAVRPGGRVVIVDDLLATGGTARATADLVREQEGKVVAFVFVVELVALEGRGRLEEVAAVDSLLRL